MVFGLFMLVGFLQVQEDSANGSSKHDTGATKSLQSRNMISSAVMALLQSVAGAPTTVDEKYPRLRKTQQDCVDLSDAEDRAWCMSMLPANDGGVALRRKRHYFEMMIGACKWEDDPTPWALINVLWSPKTNTTAGPQRQYSKTHYKWQGPNATVKLQRCKATDSEGNVWVNARVGPLLTTGGYDWSSSSFEALTFPEYTDQLISVTGFFVGSTRRSGTILGYPPIHQHHFHVVPAGVDVAHESGTLSHGDSACADEYGGGQPGDGVACQIRIFPPGHALYMQPILKKSEGAVGTLKAFAEVNDVRVANSPPLEHYITTSLRLNSNKSAAERPRPIYLQPENFARVWGPKGGNVPNMKERDAAFFPKPGYASTQIIPGNRTTALFDAAVVTRGYTLRWSYFHMHSAWQKEYRVYMGATPAQLGLDKLGAQPGVLIEEADRIAQIERLMTDSPVTPACVFSRSNQPGDNYAGTAEPGDVFYRLNSGACTNFHVSKGTPFVIVAVFAPASPAVAIPLANVHFATRMFVDYDAGDGPDTPYVPTRDGSPNWNMYGYRYVLSAGGGPPKPWMFGPTYVEVKGAGGFPLERMFDRKKGGAESSEAAQNLEAER